MQNSNVEMRETRMITTYSPAAGRHHHCVRACEKCMSFTWLQMSLNGMRNRFVSYATKNTVYYASRMCIESIVALFSLSLFNGADAAKNRRLKKKGEEKTPAYANIRRDYIIIVMRPQRLCNVYRVRAFDKHPRNKQLRLYSLVSIHFNKALWRR